MAVMISICAASPKGNADAIALAQVMWHESADIPSDAEKVAVAWCVLNRVDSDEFPDTVIEVLEQPGQFEGGYDPDYPVEPELYELALDVLERWETGEGRVLPQDYLYYHGDGKHNYFRKEYDSTEYWDWSLPSPYKE